MPSMVRVSGCVPWGVAAIVEIDRFVLLPVVVVVVREIPATEFVLFKVMAVPLAMFAVVTVKEAAPACPAVSVPFCVPTLTVLATA